MNRILFVFLVLVCGSLEAGDQLYRKTSHWEYYWHNGCQYRRQVYTYEPYSAQSNSYSSTTTITKQDLSEDGWRGKLLEIAKQRDAWEGSMRKSAVEHGEFVDSIKVLGLENNFKWNGYGYQFEEGQQGAYGSVGYSQLPAQQGSTLYGYKEQADIYANYDIAAAVNSLIRLNSQITEGHTKATSEVHGVVSEVNQGAANVAEINAKGLAAAEVLKAASAQDRVSILKEFWAKGADPTKFSITSSSSTLDVKSIIDRKCVGCHSGAKVEGGIRLETVSELSKEDRLRLVLAISPNSPKPMPPKDNPQLTVEEKSILLNYYFK